MTVITNDLELIAALNDITNEVMPVVQKNISEELDKNIMSLVYELDYFPNKYYYNKTGQPTWQFRHAFQWMDDPMSMAGISKILYYNWGSLQADEATYLHADPTHGDNREMLAEYLDVEGYDNGILGGKLRGAYWKNTMDDLLSGTIEGWIKKEFSNYGITKT